jgi:FAD-linked sulfhydryl oxidase
MAGKFPDAPTADESKALKDFIYLFARLYPCGDCAKHFQGILARNPPDTTSRKSVTQWACKVHNLVNERLKKEIFDCTKVDEMWKCGCAKEEEDAKN